MKFLVIGQSVEDHIKLNKKILIKPGGIFYSVSALVNLKDRDDVIYLCTSVAKNKEHLFYPLFSNVDDSMFNYSDAVPVVQLTIHDNKEREELYENITKPLELDLNSLNQFDAIYINMVTGFDITVEQIQEIRRKFKGIIYIDIHTLARGYDSDGKREFRIIPDAGKWISSADIIQVNENELFSLSSRKDEFDIIKEVLDEGVRGLIVTKGDKGARLYYKIKDETASVYVSAIKINTLNKIGCGDVFGAVYFYYYSKLYNLYEALRYANIAAGLSAEYTAAENFNNIKNDVLTRYN